jgi:hypothetical protein
MRALGDPRAESRAIDPIHCLVVPRMLGLAISVFCDDYRCRVRSGWVFAFTRTLARRRSASNIGGALQWRTSSSSADPALRRRDRRSAVHGLSRPLHFEAIANVAGAP